VGNALFRYAAFTHAPRTLLRAGRDTRLAAPRQVLTYKRTLPQQPTAFRSGFDIDRQKALAAKQWAIVRLILIKPRS